MITFRPSYPGSPVEHALLGAVIVGGVHADGKRGAWYSALPSGGMKPLFWNRTDSVEAARAALTDQVVNWCDAARTAATPATLARIRASIEQWRETFCLAAPGSDEECRAYVDALDFALDVIAKEQAALESEVA